jgi:CBS domain-containing protein
MKVLDTISTVLKQKGSEIWFIDPEATVYEALEILSNRGIGALLAMRDGALLGVLSERDYARRVILKGRSSKGTKVSEIMSSPVITVGPDCSVDEAMRLMTENRVRHLPVKSEDGSISGLVSLGDLVKWIITSHEKTIEQLENYIGGKSPGATSG